MTQNLHKSDTVCFVAGRSGGHLVPALTLAARHKESYQHRQVILITTNTELDKTIVHQHSAVDHLYHLELDNLPGKFIHRYPLFLINLVRACWNSFGILRRYRPKKIICTGGYIAFPACLAATLLRIPIELYELNAVPGRAIKVLAPLATSIACCFSSTKRFFPAHKTYVASYPIRFNNDACSAPSLPRGFCTQRKTILVIGGSQGSFFINSLIKQWIGVNDCNDKIQIIHQTGTHHEQDLRAFYAQHTVPAVVFGYTPHIDCYYRLADIVICRAGAGSLFETLFFQKPCITIPLETQANDHQIYNAQACAQEYPSLVTVIYQRELEKNPTLLQHSIAQIFTREHIYTK